MSCPRSPRGACGRTGPRVMRFGRHFLQVRRSVGPPWGKDHKVAMAAAIVAAKARQR